MTSSPVSHSCPFAAALDADDASSVNSNTSATAPLVEEVKRCPAFQQTACPFKDARSSEEVRQTLAKVPPSHFDSHSKFFRVIRELHSIRVDDEAFSLPGGCPVQHGSVKTFHDALEDFSFAAVMASLARQEEDHERHREHNGTNPSEDHATARVDSIPSVSLDASPNPVGTTLSQSLKTGTAASHQAAEDVHFVANFIKGKIDRKLYAQLVHMLYHVYQALEECLDKHANQYFPSCHFPEQLCRTPSLEQDMDFWFGGKPPRDLTPATRDYVNRIHAISNSDPLLLLAHSYTRYLGDLSGGRILARVAKRAMNLGGDASNGEPIDGLAFYHFGNIESPKKFKDEYRTLLDALPLNQAQIDRLVAEANVAFYLNVRLFEELDVMANVQGASVRPLEEALAFTDGSSASAGNKSQANECPFATLAKKERGTKGQGEPDMLSGKQCPWPFILVHDPYTGCRDWKTWAVAGLALCMVWSYAKP